MTEMLAEKINTQLLERLERIANKSLEQVRYKLEGYVTRLIGLTIESVGIQAGIGEKCYISNADTVIDAEVVGFSENKTYLMPSGDIRGIIPGSKVVASGERYLSCVGSGLIGRVVNSRGQPLDNKGDIVLDETVPLNVKPLNPYRRALIKKQLDVGVRAINGILPIGRGQRVGLLSGSGVGKSMLLGMMTRYTSADIIVVGMIGERGREVREFVEDILGRDGMTRAIVVASPADTTPMERMHGALYATSIAEYFRDQGKNVLLLVDSLTRYAQAQREIALAIGEPPATKGYPPSVFAKIPQLVERAGNGLDGIGSITAIFTVLMEGDDQQDPVVDSARAILDGHIVLSRELSDKGHYPAIDIEASVSRLVNNIAPEQHINNINCFKNYYSTYMKNLDMISVGAYEHGSNHDIDKAILFHPEMISFLRQKLDQRVLIEQSLQELNALVDKMTQEVMSE